MATDTKVTNLVFNVLTQEQYDSAEKIENELYLIEDEDGESDDPDTPSSPIPIEKGGTGASDAETARSNLGVPSKEDMSGAIGDSKTFIAIHNETTAEEIMNAINAGRNVVVKSGNNYYMLSNYDSSLIRFARAYQSTTSHLTLNRSTNTWASGKAEHATSSHTHTPGSIGAASLGDDGKVLSEQLPDANITSVVLTTSGWTLGSDGRYYQTVPVAGVTVNTPVIMVDVDLSTSDADAKIAYLEAWALPSANEVTQGNGSLTFYAWEVPASNIPVNVGVM